MLSRNKKQNKGFTLVEIIVALGLFVIVATMSIGALLTMMDVNQKTKTLSTAMDNLNISIERMVRELRTGAFYFCNYTDGDTYDFLPPPTGTGTPQVADCSGGKSAIVFLSQDGETIVYKKSGNTIQRSNNGGISFVGILAQDISINNILFYVNGSGLLDLSGYPPTIAGNTERANVIISIEGSVSKGGENSTFTLQTMATQRSSE